MTDDVITLIGEKHQQDKRGAWKPVVSKNEIFCKKDSVSFNEFFSAGKIGLKPEMRFIIFPGDYSGEKEVEYHGKPYAIYRTYEASPDQLEIYVTAKVGVTNGKKSST